MKKVRVGWTVDHIYGHIIHEGEEKKIVGHGHMEGVLKLSDEEYEKFMSNRKQFLEEGDYASKLDLIMDDFTIDKYDHDIKDIIYQEVRRGRPAKRLIPNFDDDFIKKFNNLVESLLTEEQKKKIGKGSD